MSDERKATPTETLTVASENLTDKIKELIAEGNVRRVIVRKGDGKELLNIPLTGGAVAGGALVIIAPFITAIGVIAALVSSVRVEVIREGDPTDSDSAESAVDLQATDGDTK